MNLDELIAKMRAKFTEGSQKGMYVNPNGPEAADTITRLKDALDIARVYVAEQADDRCKEYGVIVNCEVAKADLSKIDAALTTTKIEKDGQ